MSENRDAQEIEIGPIIREIVELERRFYFGKPAQTRRRKELKEIIEKHVKPNTKDDT